ncbi:hypothetical protein ACHAWX_001149 [Stephanocyclus meneghinianus]
MSQSENEDDVVPPAEASQYDDDSDNDVAAKSSASEHPQAVRDESVPTKKTAVEDSEPSPTHKARGARSKSFDVDELLFLSKAYMKLKHSTEKRADNKFWDHVAIAYRELVAAANERKKFNPEFNPIGSKRTAESLRSCWSKRIHPAVLKFSAIVHANPPTSEQLADEEKLDSYYAQVRRMYVEQSSSLSRNFPKNFARYMKSYHYLSMHPDFEVEFPRNGSKPPSKNAALLRKSHEVNSCESIRLTSPPSRDSRPAETQPSTKTKPIDHVEHTESHSVSSVSFQTNTANKMSEMCKSIQDCLNTANEQMKSIIHHQVMSQAPAPVRKKYYEDLYATIAMEAANKRRRLELEAAELEVQRQEMERRKGELEVQEPLLKQTCSDCC